MPTIQTVRTDRRRCASSRSISKSIPRRDSASTWERRIPKTVTTAGASRRTFEPLSAGPTSWAGTTSSTATWRSVRNSSTDSRRPFSIRSVLKRFCCRARAVTHSKRKRPDGRETEAIRSRTPRLPFCVCSNSWTPGGLFPKRFGESFSNSLPTCRVFRAFSSSWAPSPKVCRTRFPKSGGFSRESSVPPRRLKCSSSGIPWNSAVFSPSSPFRRPSTRTFPPRPSGSRTGTLKRTASSRR